MYNGLKCAAGALPAQDASHAVLSGCEGRARQMPMAQYLWLVNALAIKHLQTEEQVVQAGIVTGLVAGEEA